MIKRAAYTGRSLATGVFFNLISDESLVGGVVGMIWIVSLVLVEK